MMLTVLGTYVAAMSGMPDGPAAGVIWKEFDEAGSLPVVAQRPVGVGNLAAIEGDLPGVFGGPAKGTGIDFEDLYLIRICDPEQFIAETVGSGLTDFDTQLWLFEAVPDPVRGFGRLGNDNVLEDDMLLLGSRLLPQANDGTNEVVALPGLYYVGISGFNNDPQSSGGLIFDQASDIEISGPDGPGGGQPLQGWTGPGETGSYFIGLQGVSFALGTSLDCNGNGLADACELRMFPELDLNGDGIPDSCAGCPDFAGEDRVIDTEDLLTLLAAFGPCPEGCPVTEQPCGFDLDGDCFTGVTELLLLLGSWGPCEALPECIYRYDSGQNGNSVGLTEGGTVAWLQYYETDSFVPVLGGIRTAFGTPAFPDSSGVTPGAPVQWAILGDANGNGRPDNGDVVVANATVPAAASAIDTGTPQYIPAIADLSPFPGFFIGFAASHGPNEFPAALDASVSDPGFGPSGASVWGAGDAATGPIDWNRLDDLGLSPAPLSDFIPGVWLNCGAAFDDLP